MSWCGKAGVTINSSKMKQASVFCTEQPVLRLFSTVLQQPDFKQVIILTLTSTTLCDLMSRASD